jgi:hypothetical protein
LLPIRQVGTQRGVEQAPAQLRHEVDAAAEQLADEVRPEAFDGGCVDDGQRRDVKLPRVGLSVEEGGVRTADLTHAAAPDARCSLLAARCV